MSVASGVAATIVGSLTPVIMVLGLLYMGYTPITAVVTTLGMFLILVVALVLTEALIFKSAQ